MKKLTIIEQPFITPSGKLLDGVERVVDCPMWLCKVNVKKVCGKCTAKDRISYKEQYVNCKYNS